MPSAAVAGDAVVLDRAQVLEHDDGGDDALVVVVVELARELAGAAVAHRGVGDALVEVRRC